jgi:hypothetical protein
LTRVRREPAPLVDLLRSRGVRQEPLAARSRTRHAASISLPSDVGCSSAYSSVSGFLQASLQIHHGNAAPRSSDDTPSSNRLPGVGKITNASSNCPFA